MNDATTPPAAPPLPDMGEILTKAPPKLAKRFRALSMSATAVQEARSAEPWCNAMLSHCRSLERMAKLLRKWPGDTGSEQRSTAASKLAHTAKVAHNLVLDVANPAILADELLPRKEAWEKQAAEAEISMLTAIGSTVGLMDPPEELPPVSGDVS